MLRGPVQAAGSIAPACQEAERKVAMHATSPQTGLSLLKEEESIRKQAHQRPIQIAEELLIHRVGARVRVRVRASESTPAPSPNSRRTADTAGRGADGGHGGRALPQTAAETLAANAPSCVPAEKDSVRLTSLKLIVSRARRRRFLSRTSLSKHVTTTLCIQRASKLFAPPQNTCR